MENREKEMKQKETYQEGWKISAKYSTILMDHEDRNEYFEIAPNVYHQFIQDNYGISIATSSVHINIGIDNLEQLFAEYNF